MRTSPAKKVEAKNGENLVWCRRPFIGYGFNLEFESEELSNLEFELIQKEDILLPKHKNVLEKIT